MTRATRRIGRAPICTGRYVGPPRHSLFSALGGIGPVVGVVGEVLNSRGAEISFRYEKLCKAQHTPSVVEIGSLDSIALTVSAMLGHSKIGVTRTVHPLRGLWGSLGHRPTSREPTGFQPNQRDPAEDKH